jgi:FMN-dependent NADH-azoreductase
MPTLLHVSASPRGDDSESRAIAATFLQTLADARPDITIRTWDLWDGGLPPFGPDAVAAKMAVFAGAIPTGAGWDNAVATFERFAAADYYLFSVPMWNAGIPYILKQLIDVISQPGLVYSFDPVAGYTGLITGRPAVVVYTSAVYGPGRPPSFGSDFQAPFFEDWLRWAGFSEITSVAFRPNLAATDVDARRQQAHQAAREAAKRL